ncbi:MAG: hypothetical protein R2710_05515 [Acidimicrobiales bacterium]
MLREKAAVAGEHRDLLAFCRSQQLDRPGECVQAVAVQRAAEERETTGDGPGAVGVDAELALGHLYRCGRKHARVEQVGVVDRDPCEFGRTLVTDSRMAGDSASDHRP